MYSDIHRTRETELKIIRKSVRDFAVVRLDPEDEDTQRWQVTVVYKPRSHAVDPDPNPISNSEDIMPKTKVTRGSPGTNITRTVRA